jgi:hypothetical protein
MWYCQHWTEIKYCQNAGSTGSNPLLSIDKFSPFLCCPLVVESLDGLIPHPGWTTNLENVCSRRVQILSWGAENEERRESWFHIKISLMITKKISSCLPALLGELFAVVKTDSSSQLPWKPALAQCPERVQPCSQRTYTFPCRMRILQPAVMPIHAVHLR